MLVFMIMAYSTDLRKASAGLFSFKDSYIIKFTASLGFEA